MSSRRVADAADRLVLVALQVFDAAPDDRERRPELVARVGRELALAAERLADRDERAAGVERPTTSAPSTPSTLPASEHVEQDAEEPLLAGDVLDHLDEVRLGAALHRPA